MEEFAQSVGNAKIPDVVGTVLARRYKILGSIDGDSFKAHDLTLDQTVTVRAGVTHISM